MKELWNYGEMMNIAELLMSYSASVRVDKEIYPTRVYNLLKKYNYDPDQLKYIHVTGSKGKGTLAYTSFELLNNTGIKTGLFMSPHIFDIRERFITSEGMIPQERLEQLINKFEELFSNKELHYFEICLFIAIVYFIDEKCQYVVLEVGVGGRFDPTNFCQPEVALIGHISLEHQEFLGDTIDKIAYDKAGIIKKNTPIFSIDQEKIVEDILLQEGRIIFAKDCLRIYNVKNQGVSGVIFDLEITLDRVITLKEIFLNRIGNANILNFSLAIAAIYYLIANYHQESIYQIARLKMPYRMEVVTENIIIDTAHNGVSFENLMQSLENIQWTNIILYITILQGKDIKAITAVLKKYQHLIKKIICFEFITNSSRLSNAQVLYNTIKNIIPAEYILSLDDVILDTQIFTVFAGSFYSVPFIKGVIDKQIID